MDRPSQALPVPGWKGLAWGPLGRERELELELPPTRLFAQQGSSLPEHLQLPGTLFGLAYRRQWSAFLSCMAGFSGTHRTTTRVFCSTSIL